MEQALNLSEARNRDFVEHSIYGISRVAADGTFLDANQRFSPRPNEQAKGKKLSRPLRAASATRRGHSRTCKK